MFHNKKGFSTWEVIVFGLVAIVMGAILIAGGKGLFGEALGAAGERFKDLEDYDNDKIVNLYDKCPCTPAIAAEEEELRGCPKPTSIAAAQQDQKNFKDKQCPPLASAQEATTPTASQVSSLQLMDGTVQVPSGTYHTTSASVSYRASCTSTCSLRVNAPSGQSSEEWGTEGTFLLEEFGTYQILLVEGGSTKVGYTIERTNPDARAEIE